LERGGLACLPQAGRRFHGCNKADIFAGYASGE
jgi:hypothetical protein